MHPMKAGRNSGFTLVELMAGLLATVVLAMTVWVMLVFSAGGWQRAQSLADMERDGSLAMRTMGQVIRNTPTSNQWVGASLRLNVYSNNTAQWSFTKTGAAGVSGSLVYATGTRSVALVRTGVTAFACTTVSNQVTVVLGLREPQGNIEMNMTNIVSMRNRQ